MTSITEREERELREKSARASDSAKDPMEKLRLKLLARGSNSIKGFGRVFHNMDDDRSNNLDFEEFKKGIKDIGVQMSEQDVKDLFARFDKDGNGKLSFDEFLVPLRKLSANRIKIITAAFQKLDKTGDGIVTVEDLKGVYNVKKHKMYLNGKWTEEQCFKEFLKTFDSPDDPDGKVTKDEFFNYYAGVSASVDDDVYFDLMMRQAWKI